MDADAAIIDLCRRGRPEGFASMLLTYQERVYRRAYSFLHQREDALDTTQEVFLRTIKGVQTFLPGRPIWPWLRRITANQCLNTLRSRPHLVSLDADWSGQELPGGTDPSEAAAAAWGRQRLTAALARLPPLHRMAVVLRHHEGLSYEEVAQAMDIPLGTVKTYLFRTRQALKAALAEE